MKIGVFDSGIGGIKVLEEIERNFSGHDFIYVFDKSGLPYGNKNKEDIMLRVFRVCDFLLLKKVDVIIIACNTASCIALNKCKKKYKIPVLGLIPPLNNLANLPYKNILILSTNLTAKFLNEYYDSSMLNKLVIAPQKDLAILIEQNLNKPNVIKNYMKREMTKYIGCDCVFLGCTHYYYIKNALADFFNANVLDGRVNLIFELKQLINCGIKKNFTTEFYYL